MPQIQVDEQVFEAVRRRAADAGYPSVDAYVEQMLVFDLAEDGAGGTPNLEHRFTPKLVAHLQEISAAAEAGGKTYSPDEVREHFRRKSQAWEEDRTR